MSAGDAPYDGHEYSYADRIHALITLGTPHHSHEAYPVERVPERRKGERDDLMTPEERGSSAKFANRFYPGDFFLRNHGVEMLCVCGDAVSGRQGAEGGTPVEDFAFTSYLATCGEGRVVGDGVCPIKAALLKDVPNLVLPQVHHTAGRGRLWYGDPEVVQDWAAKVLRSVRDGT